MKDPEKRAAYDQLGTYRPGEDFRPPPGWDTQCRFVRRFGLLFEDLDLGDLFAGLGGRGGGRGAGTIRMPGQDYEIAAHISLEDAYRGTEVELTLAVPEFDDQGRVRRVSRTFKVRIPKGATDGQRLALPGRAARG